MKKSRMMSGFLLVLPMLVMLAACSDDNANKPHFAPPQEML